MAEEGRRERKKRQTRAAIARAALDLFARKGYERTTIAEIAAEADVATKTFFNYFPAKEAVLFADAEQYRQMVTAEIARRAPADRPADVLIRICTSMAGDYEALGLLTEPGDAELYLRLLRAVPAVRAMALQIRFDLQREIAERLHEAFPDDLDPITAAAAVGAIMGAVQAVGVAVDGGEPATLAEQAERSRRAMEVVIAGLGEL
jgi:AcrR family transcriptional regulator